MSPLFDVPAQLVMILSLAAAGGGEAPRYGAAPNPAAHVAVSEARGPFAFREQVWLEAVQCGAGGAGLASDAARIFRTSGGRYYVPAGSERQRILKLRRDGEVAARVAFGFAKRNAALLETALSRAPTPGELYVAHALGSQTAIALVQAAQSYPDGALAEHFAELSLMVPQSASAGRPPVTVAEAVQRLKRSVDRQPNGAEVAAWFLREPGHSLAGDLKGRVGDAPGASATSWQRQRDQSAQNWTSVVEAAP